MPKRCVWPANYRNPCRQPACAGHICCEHLRLVQARAGRLDCAWPGCTWRAWDLKGLCSFHWKVAFGLVER